MLSKVLGFILFASKQGIYSRNMRYFLYIMQINKLRIEYLNCVSNNLHQAVLKNKWAEVASKDSMKAEYLDAMQGDTCLFYQAWIL